MTLSRPSKWRHLHPAHVIGKLRRLRGLAMGLEDLIARDHRNIELMACEVAALRETLHHDIAELRQKMEALARQFAEGQPGEQLDWLGLSAAEILNLRVAASKESQLAFAPDLYIHNYPAFTRFRQLDLVPLRDTRVAVLSASPSPYRDMIHTLNPASIVDMVLAGAKGPLSYAKSFASGDVERKELLTVGFEGVAMLLDDVDYFWIPDPYLASLSVRIGGFLRHVAARVKKALIISLPVSLQSIFSTQPSFQIGFGAHPFPVFYDDNRIRAILHRSGFVSVERLAPLDGIQKSTRYHEGKDFYLAEPLKQSTQVNDVTCIECYSAHKLPTKLAAHA